MKSLEADFCVVGAGYAGLTAAYRLKQAGHSVVVLEARDRIGGRVFTEYLPDGTPIDMGGTFAGPGQDRIYALAKELGCQTYSTPNKGDTLLMYKRKLHRFKGLIPDLDILSLASVGISFKLISTLSKQVSPEAPWSSEKAKEWDSMTFRQWVDNPLHAFTEPAKQMLLSLMVGLFTCDPSEVSFLQVLWHVACAGNDLELQLKVEGGAEQDMIKGGMISMARKMADSLGDAIVLNSPVTKISQDDNGVSVDSREATVKAKQVVVCTPPNLADHIDYEPALPATKRQLLSRLPSGNTIKFVCVYDEPFWRKDGVSGECAAIDEPMSMTLDTTPPDAKVGVLTGFVMGPDCLKVSETMSADERKAFAVKSMVARFGEKAGKPIHVLEHNWGTDRWTRGCHMAHYAPGVMTTYGHAIRDSVGRIHWASTETSFSWNGNIDGAIKSGERIAQKMVEAAKEVALAKK